MTKGARHIFKKNTLFTAFICINLISAQCESLLHTAVIYGHARHALREPPLTKTHSLKFECF